MDGAPAGPVRAGVEARMKSQRLLLIVASAVGLALNTGLSARASAQQPAKPANTPARPLPNKPQSPAPPPAKPAEAGRKDEAPPPHADLGTTDPDLVTLSAFAEPVQLSTLVELVGETLHVNIITEGEVPGQVVFNAPVPVKKTDLIPLLDALLAQNGFTITQNRFGFYRVHATASVDVNLTGDRATTRFFPTPNIRPSTIKGAIDSQLGTSQPAGQAGVRQIAYLDGLGMIIATDTPTRLEALGSLITRIVEEYAKTTFTRIELSHISAPVARDRMLQLVGQQATSSRLPNGQPDPNASSGLGSIDNLADRLTVDPQGNALVFRGRPQELALVNQVRDVIDVPNKLVPKKHFVGSAARQVADIARQRGLGEVTTITTSQVDPNTGFDFAAAARQQQQLQGVNNQQSTGGPVMVVDEGRGEIIYYGTQEQQDQLAALIKEIDPQSERIVSIVYRLKNAKADDVAGVINGLLTNSQPVGTSDLLPSETGARNTFQPPRVNRTRTQPRPNAQPGAAGNSEDGLSLESDQAFVIADTKNNQLIVKAPAGQQPEFAKLIERLDLRRPQVYVEAKIVAVTADDRLRLAFETQLVNAGGAGGVLNSNFGLGTFATGNAITVPKTVPTGLTGLTAAVIRSDQVPIIMRALANETDSRIISSPQLLVDDNEEAEVVSVDRQPIPTISRGTGGQGDIITSNSDAEAGTKLKVTPQISDGGYLRLKYSIELSSFTGEPTNNLPPPSQVNDLRSDSVTIPSDYTVVVGGLVLDSKTKTIAKVPFFGDIPILGLLAQDRNTGDRKTTLYVFLTPRVLRDPSFTDLRLLTRGPRDDSRLAPDLPSLQPSIIEPSLPTPPAQNPAPSPSTNEQPIKPEQQPQPEPHDEPGTPTSAGHD